MGHRTSCFFLPSCEAFSASFILLLYSRRVSSISSKPAGGGLRVREERMGGILRVLGRFTERLITGLGMWCFSQ